MIDNVIDAMDGAGTLTVSARPDAAGWVVVDIENGPGGTLVRVRLPQRHRGAT